jgi:predicted Zn finger-like uncharacterized protein
MILTCPQCETRFVVPSAAIPVDGRKVRCAKCENTWFQRPVIDDDSDDIPEIASFDDHMHGQPQSSNKPQSDFVSKIRNEIVEGYKSVLLGFAIVMVGYGLYSMLTPSLTMGQGLTFSDVQIERSDDGLIVRGNIVNTMDDVRGVPGITVTAMFDDVNGDTSQFAAPIEMLDAGQSIAIEYTLDGISENVTDLKLGFNMAATGDDHH